MGEDYRTFGLKKQENRMPDYNPTLQERLNYTKKEGFERFPEVYQMLIDKGFTTLQEVAKAIRNGDVDDDTISQLEGLSEKGYQIGTMLTVAISTYRNSKK